MGKSQSRKNGNEGPFRLRKGFVFHVENMLGKHSQNQPGNDQKTAIFRLFRFSQKLPIRFEKILYSHPTP